MNTLFERRARPTTVDRAALPEEAHMKLGLFGMPLHPPARPMSETYEENAP